MKKFKGFKLLEVKKNIFLLQFEDQYNMAMHFLRYQEFYESPNPKFRNKSFLILDFMEWYSKKYGNGNFTYPTDWVGYNFSSKIFQRALDLTLKNGDWNKYDDVMNEVNYQCLLEGNKQPYYLIGALKGNERTIKHEVAHGMFYLDKEYNKEMLKLVKALPSKFRNKLYKDLVKVGYTKEVLPDEAQAFLSTGWRDYFVSLDGEDKSFIDVFNKYYNK